MLQRKPCADAPPNRSARLVPPCSPLSARDPGPHFAFGTGPVQGAGASAAQAAPAVIPSQTATKAAAHRIMFPPSPKKVFASFSLLPSASRDIPIFVGRKSAAPSAFFVAAPRYTVVRAEAEAAQSWRRAGPPSRRGGRHCAFPPDNSSLTQAAQADHPNLSLRGPTCPPEGLIPAWQSTAPHDAICVDPRPSAAPPEIHPALPAPHPRQRPAGPCNPSLTRPTWAVTFFQKEALPFRPTKA